MCFLDKLFAKKKKPIDVDIYAPITGELINIEDVPDVVFSEKIVGDGVAIHPTGEYIVAPADGVINKIFATNHAFSMTTKEGVELFVHFGIDTVELKGDGFKRIARENQHVKRGDVILELESEKLKQAAKSILTPVVIANMEEIQHIEKKSGGVIAGESVILRLKK